MTWIFWSTYYFVLLVRGTDPDDETETIQNKTENVIMTTGSMSLRCFDVFYIEQYLAAALLMPLVLDQSLDAEEQKRRQRRASRIRYGILVLFWGYLVGWYFYSCVNG